MIRLITCLLCSLALHQVFAQERQDSLKASDQTTDLLKKMDSTRRKDSISRAELMSEIDRLKDTDSRQRKNLLNRLHTLEEKDSLRRLKQQKELADLKASAIGYPVAPFEDTLFLVYTKTGSFSAKERAQAITRKIQGLYDDATFDADSVMVVQGESTADIVYKDMVIMSVNPMDALLVEKNANMLATEYAETIRTSVLDEYDNNSLITILIRIGLVLLILGSIYLVIRLVNQLFQRIANKVIQLKDRILKGIRFKGYQFLDSDRELQIVLFLVKGGRLMVIILLLYFALPLLFSVFPMTRGWAEELVGMITHPLSRVIHGMVSYLPNLFTVGVIIFVTHYSVRFLRFVSAEIERGHLHIPGFYPEWSKPTFNIVKFLLYMFTFVIIFPYLPGSGSDVFKGVSVFLGILFSLGSTSAIANIVAGLVITYMRPFKVGDRIKIGEITGDVIDKSMLVTRIRTIKNEDITIPNSAILSGHTINFTTSAKELGLILHTSVTIGYDVPWRKVHELLAEAAKATQGILQDPGRQPFVLQTSLDDYYVAYQINAYTNESKRMAAIYSELHQNIQDKFNEAGIEIMSPHYTSLRDGNTVTIPQDYLKPDYKPPVFGVKNE